MKFKNVSKADVWEYVKGSSYQGTVIASYSIMVELFGLPYLVPEEDQDKSKVEWTIIWKDKTVSTIYDWKWYDTELEDITEWNIGGDSYMSALHIQELVYSEYPLGQKL